MQNTVDCVQTIKFHYFPRFFITPLQMFKNVISVALSLDVLEIFT